MTIATTAGTATSGCAYRTTRGARVTFKGPGATPGHFVLESEHGARFDVDGGFLLLPDATQPAIVSAVLADWGAEDAPPLADLTAQELAGVVQDAEDISLIEAIQAELKRREKPTAPEEEDPTGVDCPVCTTTTTVRGSELYDVPVLSRHKGPGSPVLCRGGEVPLMEAQRMAYAAQEEADVAKLDAMHPREDEPDIEPPTTAMDLPPPTPEQAAIERRATVEELHGSVRGSRVAIRGCEDPALIAEAIAAEREGKNRETILGQLQRRLDKLNGVKRPRKARKAREVPTSDDDTAPTPTSSSGLPPEDLTEVTSAAPPEGAVETDDGFVSPAETATAPHPARALVLAWTTGLLADDADEYIEIVSSMRPSWTPTEIAWEVCCLEGVETSEVGEAAGDALIRDREINDDKAPPNSEDQNAAALAGYAAGFDAEPLIRTSATSQRLRTGWLLAHEAGKADREFEAGIPAVYVSESPDVIADEEPVEDPAPVEEVAPPALPITPAPGVSVHGVPGRTVEETTVKQAPLRPGSVLDAIRPRLIVIDDPTPEADPAAAAGDALAALARALPGLAALGIAVEITISTRGN